MADSLAGVALGAGAGHRLHPLTLERPKVLCPVGPEPLIDHALGRLRSVTDDLAVNVHESQSLLSAHLAATDVVVSQESGAVLGTAGGLAALRSWIDGRPVLVVNGDTWCPGGLQHLVSGWDGVSIRILVPGGGPFGPRSRVAASLMAWDVVRDLAPVPSGLWEVRWREAVADGRVEVIEHAGPFVDCAGPADYLAANLAAAAGNAVGVGAVVEGSIEESVVWPGAVVHRAEHLRRAIRTDGGRTVLVRAPLPAVFPSPVFHDRPR